MLTIYRRHRRACSHRSAGRGYRRCQCPIWVDGTLDGQEIRRSLGLRDWQKAQAHVRELESGATVEAQTGPATIEDACAAFERDAEARELRPATLYKYRLIFAKLKAFAKERGFRFVKELDITACREFRQSWPHGNLAALKTLERLRAFLGFCQTSGWIPDNPAKKLANPKITNAPTMPFTRDEMASILGACEGYRVKYRKASRAHVARLRALVLLLRYSGLRIRDAVTLERNKLAGDKLMLYTAKTGTPVYCPLPPAVVQALEAAPVGERFFFWRGESNPKSAVGDWQRTLRRLFDLAKVAGGHAHRFRDTFAVELLLAGVPLDRVSILLGHQSTRITEKHYTPWVRSRQEQLEADVRQTWEGAGKGTQEVHGTSQAVN